MRKSGFIGELPVFPQDDSSLPRIRSGGMTLLEYFSGCALAGLTASPDASGRDDATIAESAVDLAEAMCEALEKRKA